MTRPGLDQDQRSACHLGQGSKCVQDQGSECDQDQGSACANTTACLALQKESVLAPALESTPALASFCTLNPLHTQRAWPVFVSGPQGESPQAHNDQYDLLPAEGDQEVGLLLEDALGG